MLVAAHFFQYLRAFAAVLCQDFPPVARFPDRRALLPPFWAVLLPLAFFQFSGILLPLSLPHRFPCFPVLPRAGSSAPLIGSGISLPCPAPLQAVPMMLSRFSDRFPLEVCPGSLCLLEMCAGSSPDRSALIGSPCSSPGSLFISCRWFRICSRGSLGSGCRPLCSVPDLSPLFVPALCLPLCRSVSLSRDPAACSPFCPSVGAWGLFCTVNIALHPNTSRQILSI